MFVISTFETVTGLPEPIAYIFIFLLGAIVGSFLNVVIHRVPLGQSIIFPNSACPICKCPIKFFDNLPILSWMILGGKCRRCKNPISPRYPAVELLTALLFVLALGQIGFNAFLPVALIFIAVIISLVFIDAENMILPNIITYPLVLLAFLIRLIFPLFFSAVFFADLNIFPLNRLVDYPLWFVSIVGAVFGAFVSGGFLWLVGEIWKRLRGVEAMGFGDVKMMFGVGALLGWRLALLSIFIGTFTGAIVGSVIIVRQKERDFQTQIPFGIFLGFGAVISLLFGDRLIRWYLEVFF